MDRRVVKNYLYNAFYQVFCIITPLITTPYVSRVLDPAGIGTFSYAQSIATYFVLFGALGSSLYGQREIAYVQNDPDKRTIVFKEIETFRIITVLLSTILYWLVFCRTGQYQAVFSILLIEVFASAFDISWFFQGIQDFQKSVMRNIVVKTLSIVLIFVMVKKETDVALYAACYAVPILLSNLSLWPYLSRYLTRIKRESFITLRHLKPLLALFLPQVATEVYTVLDKTMIGILGTGMDEVGFYEQSQKIIKILVRIITALGIVMMPKMSQLFVEGKREEINKNIENSFRFVFWLSSPLMFGIIGISQSFVPWFYGPGYDKVAVLMSVIVPIVLIIGISNVIGKQYLLPTRQQKAYTASVVTGAVVNFCANVILIPRWNAVGASIGTVLAELSVTVVQIIAVRKQLPLVKYLAENIKYLVLGAIMWIPVWFGSKIFPPRIIYTVILVIIGMIVYFTGLLLIKDTYVMKVLNKFRKGRSYDKK